MDDNEKSLLASALEGTPVSDLAEDPDGTGQDTGDGDPQKASGTQKHWFAVQVYSGFENYVKDALARMIKEKALEHQFGRILVPTEAVVEMRGGQKYKSERKFFPGYVLVEMEMNTELWHEVRAVPRVLKFIGGTANRPAPLSKKEADAILCRMEESLDKPKPKVIFEPGEVVRVTDGPFADFNGVVEEVNYEKSRLRVAVLIFGRSTPVELEFSQIEKS